jgi:hypothetical protein
MAHAQPPHPASRRAQTPVTRDPVRPVSRRDRQRRQRETRSERQFAFGFIVILAFTVAYLIARSPLMRLMRLH